MGSGTHDNSGSGANVGSGREKTSPSKDVVHEGLSRDRRRQPGRRLLRKIFQVVVEGADDPAFAVRKIGLEKVCQDRVFTFAGSIAHCL
jgi:hypothetical protein